MPDPKPNPAAVDLTASSPTAPSADATMAEGAQPVPARVGGYLVVGELGRGGMGVVYRAEDPALRREVALKMMLPRFAASPQAKTRFVREARAQAKVTHDHVAAIFQVGEDGGVPFLVMPLLQGMTLHAALRANPRPPLAEVVRIGREIAEGLAAAHEKGLVHRDIKPRNVWLEGKKLRVKVLDFGLARPVAGAGTPDPDAGPLTREGGVVGTPAYMSPEQAAGLAVDARTDLFSLGVVLYQMTTGDLPPGGAAFAVDPPPPVSLNPSVPPSLSDLVMRLLARDRDARPPTADAVVEELRRIELTFSGTVRVVPLDSIPPVVVADDAPDPFAEIDATEMTTIARPVHTPARSLRWLWAAVGLIVVLGLGVAAWVASGLLWPKKPEPTADPEPAPAPRPVVAKKETKAADPDREAAEELLPYVDAEGALSLRLASGKIVDLRRGESLPAGPFTISAITWGNTNHGPDLVNRVLFPAVVRLQNLDYIYDPFGQFRITDANLAKLAESPMAGTLKALGTPDLNPQTVATLKRFPKLTLVVFRHDKTTDQLPALKDLPAGINHLQLEGLGHNAAPSEAGLAALSALRVNRLYFHWIKSLDRRTAKAVAAMPELINFNVAGGVEPGAVAELAASRSITHLTFHPAPVTDTELKSLHGMARLRHLNVRQTKVTEAGVKELAAALPRCRIQWDPGMIEPSDAQYREASRLLARGGFEIGVQLADGTTVTAKTPAELPDAAFTMVVINKGGGVPFGDDDLKRVMALRTVRRLAVEGNELTDAGLAALKESEASLAEVLVGASGITDEGLKHIAPLTNLAGLSVDRSKVTDAGVERLAGLTNLEFLAINETAVSDAGLKHLARMTKLKRLRLDDTAVSDAGLDALAALTSLRLLELKNTRVTADGRKRLQKALPNCKIEWSPAGADRTAAAWVLSVGGRATIRQDGATKLLAANAPLPAGNWKLSGADFYRTASNLTDADLANLKDCRNLEYINLGETKISDAGLVHFKDCKAFIRLGLATSQLGDAGVVNFKDCKGLTALELDQSKVGDAGLAHFKDCVGLTHLYLGETRVTDAGLAHLKNCKNLTALHLYNTQVTDAGLAHLKDCTEIVRLHLNGCGGVTDTGLAHFQNCKKLKFAYLQTSKVTDATLKQLQDCKALTELDVRKTRVTEAAVKKLAAALPKCKIEWDGETIDPAKKP